MGFHGVAFDDAHSAEDALHCAHHSRVALQEPQVGAAHFLAEPSDQPRASRCDEDEHERQPPIQQARQRENADGAQRFANHLEEQRGEALGQLLRVLYETGHRVGDVQAVVGDGQCQNAARHLPAEVHDGSRGDELGQISRTKPARIARHGQDENESEHPDECDQPIVVGASRGTTLASRRRKDHLPSG